jgi:2,4-dienoyl-CoA reductase-like NADH-dependent reductase (Old Yellow Enzyme family)
MRSRKASLEGYVTDEFVKHYTDRAVGPGLIIIEHAYIAESGRLSPQLGVCDDKFVEGLSMLTDALHAKGTQVVLQISHAGCMSSAEIIGTTPTAPSAVKNPRNAKAETPRALEKEEIDDIVVAFANAAERVVTSGFDGVEIHNAHGFLLSEFTSPLMNKRNDEYGGTLQNRIRLSLRIVEETRRRVGDYPIFCRFGVEDMLPNGLMVSEGIQMASLLAEAGVDVLDVTGGMGGAIKPGATEQGFFIPQAEAVKKTVNVPVIGVGGIVTAEFADEVIRKERVDLVAVGRAMLKNPLWAKKALKTL